MPASSRDMKDQAEFLPSACPRLVGKTNKFAVAMKCDKFRDGRLHTVSGSSKEWHLHRPREGRIQRRLLGVGSHQLRSRRYPET